MRDVYDAVADPTRRRLLDFLAEAGEWPLHALVERFPMGRTAVSKHLAILRQAGLVEARRVGRETRYRLNAAPLREIQGWVAFYERIWTHQVGRLKDLLEEENR
jgi:DNA-binding transcriptional ArsR family regulator